MTATDIVSVLQGITLFLVLVGVFWLLVNFGCYLRGMITPAAAPPPATGGSSGPPRVE